MEKIESINEWRNILNSNETYIAPSSSYFVYTPSVSAKAAFFYPICTGDFIYKPGYKLQRTAYDSFLLMYIKSGWLTVEYQNKKEQAGSGDVVLLDCYQKHAYHSESGWESIWCHFDGPMARAYYQMIIAQNGHVFSLPNPFLVIQKLTAIYQTFAAGAAIKEPLLAKQLTDILTQMLLNDPDLPMEAGTAKNESTMGEIVSYIHEHFTENITVEKLARMAMLSPYHFIRMFKKEIGYTPHEYIVNIRISTAKYLLMTTRHSIKEICFITGYSGESAFSAAFKKHVGLSPAAYRRG